MNMKETFSPENLLATWNTLIQWFSQTVLSYATLAQLGVLALLLLVAHFLSARVIAAAKKFAEGHETFEKVEAYVRPLYRPGLVLLLVLMALGIGTLAELPVYVLDIWSSLISAWIVIRLAANLIRNRSLARLVATVAWSVAALDILNLLDPVVAALDAAAVPIGENAVSLYDVIWGIATFVILIWLAVFGSEVIDSRLEKIKSITPSARVLLRKIIRIVLISLAFLVALNSTGIDLTALAVFGGALGVGLGFGLQKVVSNFISGVILLLDRSIKPGDVIQIQNTYGSINSLAARYTSVITRDGTEHLIPNEDMITQPVINWSHSHSNVRQRIKVSVSYDTDLRRAMEIMDAAAADNPRVLRIPKAGTRLLEFGDNGVMLELRMWISDPQNGVTNVSSDVMLEIWDRFKEAGIEFPFPQRVVHFADGLPAGKPDPVD